ncbi:MAG: M23 family metallopeptidase [Patescibacteria group bacterium]
MRSTLSLLRGLIVIKRHAGPLFRLFSKPLASLGLFLIRTIGIPSYRILFFLRRLFVRVVRPTKHRVLRIITNRYTVHVMMVFLIVSVVFVNVKTREVRAETFGQKSIFYSLVAVDQSEVVEVVKASDRLERPATPVAYLDDTVLDARAHIDFGEEGASYATPVTGGDSTAVASVPSRTETETYTVQDGDTLGKIAMQYGLNLSTILWANNLTFRSTIRPGAELKILPTDGVLYTVRSGDTLLAIAKRYSTEVDTIRKYNEFSAPDRLSIGAELLIAGGEPPAQQAAPRRTASVAQLFTTPASKAQKSADSDVVGGWVWPTNWHTITQYYGWRHTGVDIDGDYTTHSYAAHEGVVIYAGWRSGYGLTVEIDHGNGYVTRYGHHSEIYVKVGDVMQAGDVLARTGTTGHSTGTHLHFEVIKNGKFQNPLDYVR